MKRFVTIEIFCLSFLAGCTLGPNYHEPKLNIANQWASPLKGGEINADPQLADWWKNFNDEDLNALMTQAVQSNFTLRMACDRVREARAQRDVAYGGLWPSLSNQTSYARNRYWKNGFPPLPAGIPLDYNEYNLGFDASWEIDIFGGRRRAVEAANAEVGAAQYSQRDVLVSLLAEVARNYINVRTFQQRLMITQENIKIQEQVLELTTSRYKNGLSSDLDVEQAKAILETTRSQVPLLQDGLEDSVFHLSVLVGKEPGNLMQEMSLQKSIPLTPPMVPVGLPSALLQRRPDVQKALDELAAATARIGEAKAELFPKFSLTGMAGVESLSTNDWIDNASRYWTAGPTMQWQLFEAGRIRAQIRVQNARQQEALDVYQQTVLTAFEEVEGALTAYAKEQTRRVSLNQSLEANQKAMDISAKLYKSGLANFISVLDTERALFEAQDALVQSDQAVSLNLVQLYKALGGGWEAGHLK